MKQQGTGCLPFLFGSVVCLGVGFWLLNYSGWAWLLVITGLVLGLVAWAISSHERELALREQLRTEYPGVWQPWTSYEETREKVLQRDNYRCRQCGSTFGVEVHHMTKRANGGTNEPGNLVTLCKHCHDSKHPGARKYYVERWKSGRGENLRRR
jgi:hypothetical protein